MPKALTTEEQFEKLKLVLDITRHAEVNVAVVADPGDVVYLQAANTPKASQIVHPLKDRGYDIWTWGPKRMCLVASGVTAERAAEIVVAEYLHAKAQRIAKLHPEKSMKEIIATLSKGYQRKPTGRA